MVKVYTDVCCFEQVHAEPESVTFEGTTPVSGEENQVQEKEDFLLEGEEFESFTAEESQTGFELGLTGSPKQVFNESYTHSTADHSTHERERHVSSSSKTSPSTGAAKDTGLSVVPSESVTEESEENCSISASSSIEPTVKPVADSMISAAAAAASSHSTPVHQPLRAVTASTTSTLPPTPGVTAVPFQQFSEMSGTEDLFTIGLHMSDEDRRFDAWIPSEETKRILSEISSGQSVITDYSSEILATPGITVEEAQVRCPSAILICFMCVLAKSAGSVKYTNCISAEGYSLPANNMTLNNLMVRLQ